MLQIFQRLFCRYGTQIRLISDSGEQTVRGFFYSVNSRSWQNMEQVMGPLGEIPRGQYICVLPVQADPVAGNTVQVGQKSYYIRRAEDMRAGEEVLYRWCLCVEKGGDDTW